MNTFWGIVLLSCKAFYTYLYQDFELFYAFPCPGCYFPVTRLYSLPVVLNALFLILFTLYLSLLHSVLMREQFFISETTFFKIWNLTVITPSPTLPHIPFQDLDTLPKVISSPSNLILSPRKGKVWWSWWSLFIIPFRRECCHFMKRCSLPVPQHFVPS